MSPFSWRWHSCLLGRDSGLLMSPAISVGPGKYGEPLRAATRWQAFRRWGRLQSAAGFSPPSCQRCETCGGRTEVRGPLWGRLKPGPTPPAQPNSMRSGVQRLAQGAPPALREPHSQEGRDESACATSPPAPCLPCRGWRDLPLRVWSRPPPLPPAPIPSLSHLQVGYYQLEVRPATRTPPASTGPTMA